MERQKDVKDILTKLRNADTKLDDLLIATADYCSSPDNFDLVVDEYYNIIDTLESRDENDKRYIELLDCLNQYLDKYISELSVVTGIDDDYIQLYYALNPDLKEVIDEEWDKKYRDLN